MDFDNLADGLGAGARRRLWLIRAVIDKASPERAVEYARAMEDFITHGDAPEHAAEALPRRGELGDERAAAAGRETAGKVPCAQPEAHGVRPPIADAVNRAPEGGRPGSGGRLLDEVERRRFARLIEDGASNGVLSRAFNISLRQANCLRLTILRSGGAGKPKMSRPDAGGGMSRDEELRLQDEFLRRKSPVPQTMEDVIRFLRQRGDAIYHSGDRYVVNEHMQLTAEQLVARANRQCASSGRPPFHVPGTPAVDATLTAAPTGVPMAGLGSGQPHDGAASGAAMAAA